MMLINNYKQLIWLPFTAYIIYLLYRLAWSDDLSSFANDSVHYLVMARHYSPWVKESAAIASAWLLQDFPPFFPWLLAITGAAHSFLYAHALVVSLGLCSLFLYYLLIRRWLNDKWWAIFPVMVFALSPGFLLGLQGILSESLFLFLTLFFFWQYSPENKKSTTKIILLSILLSAILLTRTVGIALCFALLAQAFFASISDKKIHFQSILLAVFSLAIYFLLMAIWGPVKESHYLDVLIAYVSGQGLSAEGTGYVYQFSFAYQLKAFLDNWTRFWILFLVDEYSPIHIVATLLLFISLCGLLIRLVQNKYDAWYTLFYMLTIVSWPHPGQMFRLIFPIMPLLLVYGGYAIICLSGKTLHNRKKQLLPAVFYLFVLAAILPSHAFINTVLNEASARHMIPIHEYFHRADPERAHKELRIHNQMLRDFRFLAESVPPGAGVMYFLPSYIAILSDRTGITSKSPIDKNHYQKIASENHASYIFLTRLHPRNSSLGYNALRGHENLKGWTNLLWCSQLHNDEIVSCLYKINNEYTVKH